MKQKKSSQPTIKEDLANFENNLSLQFEKVNKKLEETENILKVSDQKRYNAERELRFQITTSSFDTQQKLEKTLRAEIQVVAKDLEERLEAKLSGIEKRLNQRITMVGDLITLNFTKILENHEKRINKLEESSKIAH